MQKEKLDRIVANHQRARGTPERTLPATEDVPTVAEQPDTANLDDHSVQDRIMNPDGTDVELSYATVHVYPPSIQRRRQIFGFCSRIMSRSIETATQVGGVIPMRAGSIVTEEPKTEAQALLHIAYLLGRAGQIDDRTAPELATEISNKADPGDILKIFAHLCLVSGVYEVYTNPKN